MSVIDVVAEFASRESLPVQVDDVADFLKSKWVKDEFYFFETDIDPGILRGFITVWDYPRDNSGYSTATVADIHYSKNDTPDWQRLVSTKEMLHLLDGDESKIYTEEEVHELIDKIILAPELQKAEENSHKINNDLATVLKAVAVLFPWACRELFMPKYKEGAIKLQEIARISDIPLKYVALVMSEAWPYYYEIISTGKVPEQKP